MRPSRACEARPMSLCSLRKAAGIFLCCCALAACHKSGDGGNAAADNVPPPGHEDLSKDFSGDEAFAYTKAQVDFGPRPAGSEALAKTRDYIVDQLKQAGWDVELQKFTDDTPHGKIDFVNLIARFPLQAGKPASTTTQQAIVCSHYDTKFFDTIKFVGASDGASSTGALIELARVLARDPGLAARIELVFFDGEEAVAEWSATDGTYGSRHFAAQLHNTKQAGQFKFGILWDMIGKKDVTITLSPDSPPDMAKGIFSAADALNQRKHFTYYSQDVWDDQRPLNEIARIPTIDLIDFHYDYWHTADDTLDKLSPESLQIVGAVTLYYLQQRLAK
ncbi:MAG TPA: M28 family peptidase [Chthoniobacteraceae bacterium]|nr:M28 family peptidase [Chthoniobacteraceae bacterium]